MVESCVVRFARSRGWNVAVRHRERGSTEGKSEVAQEPAQIRRNFAVFVDGRRIRSYFYVEQIRGRMNRLLDSRNN